MRLILALAALAALSACDQSQPVAINAAPAAQASLPAPSVLPTTAPVRMAHHRRVRREERYARSEYSESSETSTYGYVSDSRSYGAARAQGSSPTGYALWVDGFGQGYNADRPALAPGTMTRARLKPWAYYDEDWER
jgi:hypothetical protein